jgi:DNA invertase Pin-like site-specific DNA recombinase
MSYCIYLRKSRTDIEAEARGEGETLARHEKMLMEAAKKLDLPVTNIYREIVSGETIASRPVMQQILSEVEQGIWKGVLVTEIERLARGDTIDQGIVAQAFKFSNTKIITPMKTFDPLNEFDEEYFEFGLFMSRREYKMINRRLQNGRLASAKEGKYVGSIAPYGYKRIKLPNEKGFTLEIVPEHAEIVRLIFSFYTEGELCDDGSRKRLGIQSIARKLNSMGIPPARHDYWQKETITNILDNPTYAGKIRWGYRKTKKKVVDGNFVTTRPITNDESCIVVKGKHEAIIDEAVFDLVQYYISQIPPAPVGYRTEIRNPLAGLIICGKCGRSMVYRRGTDKKPPYIVCHARACDNISAPYPLIEKRFFEAIKQWFEQYTLNFENSNIKSEEDIKSIETIISKLETDYKKLSSQLTKAHEAFEQEIYTAEQFLERSKNINERTEELKSELSKYNAIYDKEKKRVIGLKEIVPKAMLLLDTYNEIGTLREKNDMLKQIIEKAVYLKENSGSFRGFSADGFQLKLFPRIPK